MHHEGKGVADYELGTACAGYSGSLLEVTEANALAERDVRAAMQCALWAAQQEPFGRLLAPRQGHVE